MSVTSLLIVYNYNLERAKTAKLIQQVGSDKIVQGNTNARILEQLQSRQTRWKVLEDDSEDEDGNIKITDDFEEVDGDQEDEEQDE